MWWHGAKPIRHEGLGLAGVVDHHGQNEGHAAGDGAVLAVNKRLSLLPEIYSLFAQYKANQEKTVDVEVVSAFDLADATRDKLAAVLGKKLEREVKVRTSTDRNLLGGVLIRAGDLVIDGSIRGRLNKLAAAMNS